MAEWQGQWPVTQEVRVQTPDQLKSFAKKAIKIKGKVGLCLQKEVASTPFLDSNNFNVKVSCIVDTV